MLRDLYEDLHRHPELSGEEHRTATLVSRGLRDLGMQVHEGIGGTGVVGVLVNGTGPTVLLRADMDALPVTEDTGLPYASTVPGVMHACGHDLHVTCLLGAAGELTSSRQAWSGTLVVLFQPAEETVSGAAGMVADGLFDKVPVPDVVLGQHVAPLPIGVIGLRPGPAFAASDCARITLYGRGGHGSRPEATVDPVVMAAAVVMRLQGIVAREIAGMQTAVVTVGAVQAGTKANIIPDTADLLVNVRSYDAGVRTHILSAIERIVAAEALASGAPREPHVEWYESAPAVVNDEVACDRTRSALGTVALVVDPGTVTGSEDVGILAAAAGAPLVYWLLGGADPGRFEAASTVADIAKVVGSLPSNHSPEYAPVPEPTLQNGVAALVVAARAWLASPPQRS